MVMKSFFSGALLEKIRQRAAIGRALGRTTGGDQAVAGPRHPGAKPVVGSPSQSTTEPTES